MRTPSVRELTALFKILDREAPGLRPVCRWLILGADLASAILAQHARPPTVDEMTTLARLVAREDPRLAHVGLWLIADSEHEEAVTVELELDRLIATPETWHHPTEVLGLPTPDLDRLLAACVARLEGSSEDQRSHLQEVEAKLRRAARIAASAREKRRRRR